MNQPTMCCSCRGGGVRVLAMPGRMRAIPMPVEVAA